MSQWPKIFNPHLIEIWSRSDVFLKAWPKISLRSHCLATVTSQPSDHFTFFAKKTPKFRIFRTCIWCIRFEPKGGLTKNYRICEFMNCKKFENLFIRALTHKYFLLTTIRKLQLEIIQTKIRKLPKRSPFYVAKKLLFLGSRSDVFPKAWLKIYKSFGPRSAKA